MANIQIALTLQQPTLRILIENLLTTVPDIQVLPSFSRPTPTTNPIHIIDPHYLTQQTQHVGDTPHLILLKTCQETCLHTLLKIGIKGILLHHDIPTTLIPAIHQLAEGQYYLGSPQIISELLHTPPIPSLPDLTPREQDLFHLLLRGYTNQQIANHLNLAHQTVRNRLHTLYHKMNVASREELIIWAWKNGFPPPA